MSSGPAIGRLIESGTVAEQPLWYAIRTRSRHEKMVADQLDQQGIENFLPLVTRKHKWSDRVKEVQLPLFSGYTFVRVALLSPDRLRVLQTHGVAGLVGVRGAGIAIPDEQIESLKTVLHNEVPFAEYPYLQVGQRVRVRGGALDGVVGILAQKDQHTLVISVEPIHRSLSIHVAGYRVEPV
jgi:transcription termination/antitermination protein NusG